MTTKEEVIANNPYKPELKKVISYKKESPDSFTIRLDWKLKYDPGQFVFCSLPGIGESPISICSHSPNYVELNIREVGNVTNALANIKEGDELLVRGPYGTSYPMEDFENDDLIIVGGGCGVAPLKGVLEYVEQNKEKFGKISLFFGFRTPEYMLFEDDHSKWQEKFDFNMSYDSMSDEEKSQACYIGAKGFVTQLVESKVENNDKKIAILCGPPIMIEKTIEILKKKGFNDDQIFLSAERLMYCGMGKCGRCMIHGKYTCLDGSVFRYDKLNEK